MKIKSVIIGCDSNPGYTDFWPIVSKQWRTRLGIKPILCYVGKNDSHISREYGDVVRYEPMKSIPSEFQGQWVRFFHATTCSEDVVMIADIDLLPTVHPFYSEWLALLGDDKYVHTSWTFAKRGRFAACYHVARGNLMKKVWDLPDTWEESVRTITNYSATLGKHPNDAHKCGLDERYTTKKMLEYPDQSVFFHFIKCREAATVSKRLWYYDARLLGQNYYLLFNLPTPYKKYRHLTDALCRQRPIPSVFYQMYRLAAFLRGLRNRTSRGGFLRVRTRLPYRLVYGAYLRALNFYFKTK